MTTDRRASLAFGLVLILVPIYVGRIQELVPYLDVLHIAKISMILGLVALGLTADTLRTYNRSLFSIPQVKIMEAIYILGLIGIPFSIWPGGSLDYLINGLLKLLLFIYLLIACTSTEEDMVKVLWSFVLCMMILAFVGIIAPSLKAGRVYASGTYDPNDMALALVLALPLMYYMAERYAGWKKLLLIGGMFLTLLIIIKTGSRGGFLALVSAAAAVFFEKGLSFTLKRIPIIAVVVMVMLTIAPQQQIERLTHMFDKDYNTTAKGGREEIWKRGVNLMLHNPIVGIGIGQFTVANGKMEGGTWNTAHNSYIQIGAELGLPGIALFIMLIRKSFLSLREAEDILKEVWIIKGLRAGFYGLCVGMIFLSWAYSFPTYFMFGLCIVIRKIHLNAVRAGEGVIHSDVSTYIAKERPI